VGDVTAAFYLRFFVVFAAKGTMFVASLGQSAVQVRWMYECGLEFVGRLCFFR
jgi:hypothetical protein